MAKPKRPISTRVADALQLFREQIRPVFSALEASAARIEELLARSGQEVESATFLGGTLLPVLTYALLHQAREETQEAIADLEKSEPSDVIDRADFFASALGEMAALLKILATMELDATSPLREDWEKLADDLHAMGIRFQRATEKLEDEMEASEPPGGGPLIQIQ